MADNLYMYQTNLELIYQHQSEGLKFKRVPTR